MQPANPCTLCKGPHKAQRCPDLTDPLKEGFYSGGGAHRDHGGDDDESLQLYSTRAAPMIQSILLRAPRPSALTT